MKENVKKNETKNNYFFFKKKKCSKLKKFIYFILKFEK